MGVTSTQTSSVASHSCGYRHALYIHHLLGEALTTHLQC